MIVYVLDTETTGLKGYPTDLVLEICINEINLTNLNYKTVFNEVIGYNVTKWNNNLRNAWIFSNSSLSIDDIKNAIPASKSKQKITKLLSNQYVTSFNFKFDFDKFLYKEPFNLKGSIKPCSCIMLASAPVCKIEGKFDKYKWPSLLEAYNILIGKDIKDAHRAHSDTNMASEILIKLFQSKDWKVN